MWAQETTEQQDGVYIFDLKSGEARALPEPDLPKRSPAVSPNGNLVAFISPTSLGTQLFVYDSVTGLIQQVTRKPGNVHSPVFVSDNEIMFGSDREKENEIFIVDLTPPPADDKKKK